MSSSTRTSGALNAETLMKLAHVLYKSVHGHLPTLITTALGKRWSVVIHSDGQKPSINATREELIDALQEIVDQLADLAWDKINP